MINKHFLDKKILITGGLGFIGSNLARALVKLGAHPVLIDSLFPLYGGNLVNIEDIKDNVVTHIFDIRNSKLLRPLLKDCNFIFNLAGQTSHLDSMSDPITDLEINSTAQLQLLEACREMCPQVKVIYAGTRQIYGKPNFLPVNESHPVNPVDVNGINKLSGEQFHLLYSKIYELAACSLRLTNTYGPGMRIKDARQTFLGVWIRSLLEGKSILVYGDGLQLRDFNYVDDCVKAMLLAASSNISNGKIYNLGSDEVINLKDLASLMASFKGSAHFELIPFPPERKSIDIGNYYGDYSLINADLGWEPKVKLKNGLLKTLNYYEDNLLSYI
jgi:UDP-glucose 4-epimerase